MIISFCGHSNFRESEEYEEKILQFLDEHVGNEKADLYLGGYGKFDEFAYRCCAKYKIKHPDVLLVFITPYFTDEYQKNHLNDLKKKYDYIIYPEIENKPLKFAITYRNKWMIEKSDFVICAVNREWGGAYNSYRHAKRKKKQIFNLFDTLE